jgi:hypothetical protein
MTTSQSLHPSAAPASTPAALRPTWKRRLALAVTGFLASTLPLVWGAGSLLQLVGGVEPEHRYHQLTGQGVLLAALWLVGPLTLVVAGWRGRRPAATAGLVHVGFVAATVLAGATIPGDGVRAVAGIVAVSAALLWWALPQRPRVSLARRTLDPVLGPVGLATAALYTPFVITQRTLQATKHDEHADLTHYFDMAWVGLVVVAVLLLAAVVRDGGRLAVVGGAASLVIGASGLILDITPVWSGGAAAIGVLAVLAGGFRSRRSS